MAGRNYAYQYETSPRKLKPEYTRPVRNVQKKKSTARKTTVKKVEKTVVKKKEVAKTKAQSDGKVKYVVFGKALLLFAIIFFRKYSYSRTRRNPSDLIRKIFVAKELKVCYKTVKSALLIAVL